MKQRDSGTLDDASPWFDGSGSLRLPPIQINQVLHIAVDATPAQETLSTHDQVALISNTSVLHFSARSNAPLRLLVSASQSILGYDYFAARDAGELWPLAGVDVNVDWQAFTVPVADMQPPDLFGGAGVPSFFFAFIIDHPEPIGVWLNDVQFK